MTISVSRFRRDVTLALANWRDGTETVGTVVDYIEGFISCKVDEILQAREDNRRAHDSDDPSFTTGD